MARRRKRASTRWNQGAASVEVKGGRFRAGAAATRPKASEVWVSMSISSRSGRRGGAECSSGVTSCDEQGNDSSEVQVQSDLFDKGTQVIKRHADGKVAPGRRACPCDQHGGEFVFLLTM